MSNVLDDLFAWAAQQPVAGYANTVQIDITSNDQKGNNLVTYATGRLQYHPAQRAGMYLFPSHFSSGKNNITQYFSDRGNKPFDHTKTDPLTVTINHFLHGGNYTITIQSSKWNFSFNFTPVIDPSTQIIYATHGTSFITVSLCDKQSLMIPK